MYMSVCVHVHTLKTIHQTCYHHLIKCMAVTEKLKFNYWDTSSELLGSVDLIILVITST